MAPNLKADDTVPPPARLSGYLLHTPNRDTSIALFTVATLLLVVVGLVEYPLNTPTLQDRLLVGAIALALPPLLVATLVANLAWAWDGRYPLRYGLQTGATGSLIALFCTLAGGEWWFSSMGGLAFGIGATGGLWYLTLRTHGSAPALVAIPFAMLAPLASLWGLFGGDLSHWFNVGLVSLLAFTAASYGFLFFADTPYQRAVGVSGMRHMAAFIEFYSTGDGRRLTRALREICQTVQVEGGWVSLRRDGEPLAFIAIPGVHPGPLGELGGSNLPSKIDPELPGLGFALHGATTNDQNPLRSEDVNRIGSAMAEAAVGAEHNSGGRAATTSGERPGAHALGLGEDLLMFAEPGDSDDIHPALGSILEGSATRGDGERLLVDLHNQEGWGRPPLPPGTAEGSALADAMGAVADKCRAAPVGALRAGVAYLPGEDLEHGIGPSGLRVLALETSGTTSALLLWDANGFAPGMNATLRDGLADRVDTLLLATTDNHYVNITPGGHNPLSGAEFLLPAAQSALAEALSDLAPVESAMGRVTITGVEILGQGMQDRISAGANAVVQVARFSWLPLYGSAAMFCMLLSPYL